MSKSAESEWRTGEDLKLLLKVIPRARREGWAGWRGDRLLVRLTAAPVDGKANARLIRFLASEFGTSASAISIERGQASRDKTILVRAPRRLPSPTA